jgi:uncharacterized protein (DUF58 family)
VIALPTPAGAVSLLLAAALALISLRASNPWLLLVACALFTPVLISQVLRADLGAISICFRSPERMAVGETVEQVFHAHNRGRRSSPAFRLIHTHPGFGAFSLSAPSLPPGGRAELVIRRTATTRGIGTDHELRLQTTAPFGMAAYRHRIPGTARISVHPAPGPVPDLIGISSGDRPAGRPARSGPELHGLREWRRGDALRQVHWRATARQERLIVIVPEVVISSRFALVVAGSSSDEGWEALLSTAAWTAVEAAAGQRPVRLSAAGTPDYLGEQADGVLDWFAALRTVAVAPEQIVRDAVDWADADGLVVVASTRPGPALTGPPLPGAGVQRALILSPDGELREW